MKQTINIRLLSLAALLVINVVFSMGCEVFKKDMPYRIGIIIPVTGDKTSEGGDIVASQRHAIDEWRQAMNEKGGINGRPVEVLVEDSNGEKAKALLCAKRLLEVDHVQATVFIGWSGMSGAVSYSHEKSRTPLVYYGWSNADEFIGNWVFVKELGDLMSVRESGNTRPYFSELIKSTLDTVAAAIDSSGRDKARIRGRLLDVSGNDNRF